MSKLNFLSVLASKLEQALKVDFDDETYLKVVLSNPADNNGTPFSKGDALYVSLLNIEEELIFREGYVTTRVKNNSTNSLQPAAYLNLQVIILAQVAGDYNKQLESIYNVIEYFQGNPLFNLKNTPQLANYGFSGSDQVSVELNTLPLKDMHYIWSNLGLKQMPAVIYKIKTLKVQGDGQPSSAGAITQINVINKG